MAVRGTRGPRGSTGRAAASGPPQVPSSPEAPAAAAAAAPEGPAAAALPGALSYPQVDRRRQDRRHDVRAGVGGPPSDDLISQWESSYRRIHPVCEEYTWRLRILLSEMLRQGGIDPASVESRTKSVESFVEKARRDGKKYDDPVHDITDLVGLRIIAYDKEDVEAIGELIEREFSVDYDNSTNKATTIELDRFGYLSIHFVVSLNDHRKNLIEWRSFAELRAEIQIRTVLQHAWAAIDHKFRYKTTNEIPTHLRRKLFRLSALLELADEEFLNLKRLKEQAQEAYVRQARAGELDMELNLTSLEAYFSSTQEHYRWADVALAVGFRAYRPPADLAEEVQDVSRRRLLQILRSMDVTTIAQVAEALRSVEKEGRDVLRRVLEAAERRGLTPLAIPYVIVGILMLYSRRQALTRPMLRQIIQKSPLLKPVEEVIFPDEPSPRVPE